MIRFTRSKKNVIFEGKGINYAALPWKQIEQEI